MNRKILILRIFLRKTTILRKILRIRLILRIRIFVNMGPEPVQSNMSNHIKIVQVGSKVLDIQDLVGIGHTGF